MFISLLYVSLLICGYIMHPTSAKQKQKQKNNPKDKKKKQKQE